MVGQWKLADYFSVARDPPAIATCQSRRLRRCAARGRGEQIGEPSDVALARVEVEHIESQPRAAGVGRRRESRLPGGDDVASKHVLKAVDRFAPFNQAAPSGGGLVLEKIHAHHRHLRQR